MEVAVGFAVHSGWAIAIVAGLGEGHLRVHDRRRVELVSPDLPRQAYHAAAGLSPDGAHAVVADVEASIAEHARTALTAIEASLAEGASLVAVGVVGRPREIPGVVTVLASHALMHASEGEQYRRGLVEAAAWLRLPVCRLDPAHLVAEVAGVIGWSTSRLADEHARARTALGPPWQKDHRDAAVAALVALSSR